MKPIILQGHERSLTQIVFNAEGDLLFSASKDKIVNVWYTSNGERLGTFVGHNGSVWSVSVDSQSRYLLTGSADNEMRLWDVSTGKCLKIWEFPTAVTRVAWNEDDEMALCITEKRQGQLSIIRTFKVNRDDPASSSSTPVSEIVIPEGQPKATCAVWAPLSDYILTGHESGKVAKFDAKTGEQVASNTDSHSQNITDIQLSPDGTYFITSSKDKTARIFDSDTLDEMKVYSTETPLNSASITPVRPYVILGGGQDAMTVTQTVARQGKFEARFYHKLFEEEEIGRLRGHFGPINTIAVHPQGKAYASGAEDGFVRVHWFDDTYFRARPFGDLEPEVEPAAVAAA